MITWSLLLPIAIILDLLLGDPEKPFHPVRWMGKSIERCEPFFRSFFKGKQFSGALFAIFLISASWILTYAVIYITGIIFPGLEIVVEILLIFYALSIHSLILAGMSVYEHLKTKDVEKARYSVSMIVGRDTRPLDQIGLTRATIETIAENFVDGIVSPLFYAAIGGAPLAIAYKMVNTLDSMIGYKNEKYRFFGCFAARIDDVVNWIPARLSVVFISLGAVMIGSSIKNTWKTAIKEGKNHLSPNAGYPEAAFSGALSIRLNGPNVYHGKVVRKPFIGKQYSDPHMGHITQACCLVLFSSLMAIVFLESFFLIF